MAAGRRACSSAVELLDARQLGERIGQREAVGAKAQLAQLAQAGNPTGQCGQLVV
jgi:hypothetical protein